MKLPFQQVLALLAFMGGLWLYIENHTDSRIAEVNQFNDYRIKVLEDRVERFHP